MFALLVSFAIASSQEQSWWDTTSDRLRGVASTCQKWGIQFSAEGAKEIEADDSPVPGRLEITGGFEGPDKFKIGISTMVGLKKALAVKLGGVFTMTPDGDSREASGGLYVEGAGLTAKLKRVAGEAMTFSGSAENMLAKVSISSGNRDESPVAFTVHLGPLDVNVDPVKYAKRLREVGPALAKAVGDKMVGGVSLSVDGGAMAAAVAHAPAPPAGYYENRLAVSLRQVLAKGSPTLEGLTSVDGVMFDHRLQDVFLIGSRGSVFSAIPTERFATVLKSVYFGGLQPFISLDPKFQGGSVVTNTSRIGGVPDELRNSSLIQTMLTADYAMKRLALGDRRIAGLRSLVDFAQEHGAVLRGAFRFWISPAPLHEGDVYVSADKGREIYTVTTTPTVLTAPYDHSLVVSKLSPDAADVPNASDLAQAQGAAGELTNKFSTIETQWPDSGFGVVRQDLELTNVCSMLRTVDVPQWAVPLLRQMAGAPIPTAKVPSEYAVIDSPKFKLGARTLVYEGGVTSDVEVPTATARADKATDAKIDTSDAFVHLGPREPVGTAPSAIPAGGLARNLLSEAQTDFDTGDLADAIAEAQKAFQIEPRLSDAAYLLVQALRESKGKMSPEAEQRYSQILTKALAANPTSWKVLWLRGYVAWSRYLDGGMDATTEHLLSESIRKDIECVIQLNPTFADAYAVRAQLEQSDPSNGAEAVNDWSVAISSNGKEPFYYYGRAGALAAESKLAQAKADLDACLALSPNNYHMLMARALTEQQLGDTRSAVADATRTTVLAPNDWECFDLLGQMAVSAGQDAEAETAMTKALVSRKPGEEEQAMAKAGQPAYPTFFERLSLWDDFVRFQGKHRDVMSAFSGQGEVVYDPEMLYVRGKAELNLGKWKQAKADLTACRRYFGDEVDKIDQLIKTCDGHISP